MNEEERRSNGRKGQIGKTQTKTLYYSSICLFTKGKNIFKGFLWNHNRYWVKPVSQHPPLKLDSVYSSFQDYIQSVKNFVDLVFFVKTFASWSEDCMGSKWKRLAWNFSRTTWQSMLMCFVCSWKVGLWVIWWVDWLSQ